MTAQLLEKLIKKLEKKSAEEWQRNAQAYHEPYGTESGTRHSKTQFKTQLDLFSIVLERDEAEHWHRSYDMLDEPETDSFTTTSYRIEILEKNKLLDKFEGQEVKTLYESVEEKVNIYEKEQAERERQGSLTRLKKVLE